MKDQLPWYQVNNIDEIDTPALLVYPERVKKNIQTAIIMVGNVDRLRPHVKTHKSPQVTQLMIEAGINKFKCATISEAEMLGMSEARDVLLAYQPTGPKLQRFVQLIIRYPQTHYSCLVDNIDSAEELSNYFKENHLQVPVFIDLDIGMHRTGIEPGEKTIELYQYCATLKGIKIMGLHAYDGHIRNADLGIRKEACNHAFKPVEKMKMQIMESGLEEPVIIAGGSHTFPIHCKRTGIECSPGTFIYWDKGNSDYCPEQDFEISALVITRIVSLPGEDKICTDLGHKSVAAENPLPNRVHFLNATGLTPVGHSEEHLVLIAENPDRYKVGTILYGVPIHICPTVALYERVITVEEHQANGHWLTLARDRYIHY